MRFTCSPQCGHPSNHQTNKPPRHIATHAILYHQAGAGWRKDQGKVAIGAWDGKGDTIWSGVFDGEPGEWSPAAVTADGTLSAGGKSPLATKHLLEDTDGLSKGGRRNPSVTSRCGSPLLSADVRSSDDVAAC